MRFINCNPKENFEEFDKYQGEYIEPKDIKDIVDEIAEAYEAAIEISEAVCNPLRLDPKTGRLVRT